MSARKMFQILEHVRLQIFRLGMLSLYYLRIVNWLIMALWLCLVTEQNALKYFWVKWNFLQNKTGKMKRRKM
jgi:hypothetical protein